MHDVAVVGAGPVGTLLAAMLQRRGLSVVLLERRAQPSVGTRAIGIHAPVLRALEPEGLTDAILDRALRVHRGEARAEGRLLGTVRFDRLSMRFPFVATLPQHDTQRALEAAAPEPLRGHAVSRFEQHADRVRVLLDPSSGSDSLEARVAVVASGAGGRELVFRPAAARAHEYPDHYVMADLEADGGPVAVVNLDDDGVLESFPLPDGRRRFVAWAHRDEAEHPLRAAERLAQAVRARGLTDVAARIDEAWPFRVRRYVAPGMRRRRVFVIGDAAHEVSPIGGQGMNLGLLDAATLAPVLAEWIRSGAEPGADLTRWEHRRLASARTAATIAAANTRLGRPSTGSARAARALALRGALSPLPGTVFARAYAMGFDRDAG